MSENLFLGFSYSRIFTGRASCYKKNILIERRLNLATEDFMMTKRPPDTYTMISIRIDNELLRWIERYVRIEAAGKDIKMSRNSVICGMLQTMREVVEYREQTEWGGKTQIEKIQEAMAAAATKHSKPTADFSA